MTTQEKIANDLKTAMKNRETLKLETIRSIKTAFTNELVATDRTPQDQLTDEESMAVIKRLYKQRLDAMEQFSAGGRQDLADKELAESKVLEAYLPEQMSDTDLETLVDQTIAEMMPVDKSKMGIVIGAVIKKTDGKADGKRVQKIVATKL